MDVNKTVHSVTVEHNGNSHTAPLIWQPSDFSIQVPTPPILKQDISNRYYYMTNFAEFVPMMNATFIDFDPDSCKFIMNADVDLITGGTNIYFNSSLYELLRSFPAQFLGYHGIKTIDCYFSTIEISIQSQFINRQNLESVRSWRSMFCRCSRRSQRSPSGPL